MKNGTISWLDLTCTLDILLPDSRVYMVDSTLNKLLIDFETQPPHVVRSYAHMLPMKGEKVDKDPRLESDDVQYYRRSIAWILENPSHQRPCTEVNKSAETNETAFLGCFLYHGYALTIRYHECRIKR